jgi:hypothetical protein
VYALGAILYECLTGRPPFHGATALDTLVQVRHQEPVPPHRLLGSNKRGCPADLETIALKCLEKEPAQRYASAAALADDLGRYLAGEPIAARPVGPAGRTWRWARRNPGWAATLGAVAGLLLLIAVGSLLMNVRLNQALRASEEERWGTLLAQARAGARSRERGQRFEGLTAIRQALRLPVPPGHSVAELRNVAIACLVLPDIEAAGPGWDGAPAGTEYVTFDAAFERYACADKKGNGSVRRVADDAQLIALEGWGRPAQPELTFSPNGQFLYHRCSPEGGLKVYRLHGAAAEVILEAPTDHETTPVAFSSDGHLFVTGHWKDGAVTVYDLQSARPDKALRRLPTGLRARQLAFRPGTAHLAVAGGSLVRVFDLKAGKTVFPDLSHPAGTVVDCLAWHPDGQKLATTCGDRRIRRGTWQPGRCRCRRSPITISTAWWRLSAPPGIAC